MKNKSQKKVSFTLKLSIFMIVMCLSLSIANLTKSATFTLTAAPYAPHTDTQVKLDWVSVSGAKYYKIFRNGAEIKTIDVNKDRVYLSYIEEAVLVPDNYYLYRVSAYSDDAMLNLIDTTTTFVQTSKLVAPTQVNAVYDVSSKAVTLSWTNISQAATTTTVKREDGTVIATLNTPSSNHTFVDPNINTHLTNLQTVRYYVIQQDSAGHVSLPSASAAVSPIQPPYVTAVMQNGTAYISLSSTSFSQEFVLERAKYSGDAWGNWSIVSNYIPPYSTSLQDTPDTGGLYRYRLSAKTNGKYSGCSNITQPLSKPVAPSSLTAVISATNRVDLSWIIDSSNECPLKIERRTGYGFYTVIDTVSSAVSTYTDTLTNPQGNTYYYRVTAYDTDNNKASSNESFIYTHAPGTPYLLSLTAVSDTQIDLNWVDNANNEYGFKVERKTDLGNFTEIATLSPNTTSYSDTTVLSGHLYTYRVSAFNYSGSASGLSNEVSYSTSQTAYAPNSLEAVTISPSQINLAWTFPDSRAYNTVIERKIGTSGAWYTIANVGAGTTSYSDTGLLANTVYSYRVKAAIYPGVYTQSYPASSSGKTAVTMLNQPTQLQAVLSSTTSVTLVWADNSDENEFIVERKVNSGEFAVIATTNANITSWSDNSVDRNSLYTYRVKARSSSNESVYSNEAAVLNSSLTAPAGLTASAISATEAELKWLDTSSVENGFEIWRRTGDTGAWQKLTTVTGNRTSYVDKNLSQNIKYYYKVRAFITENNIFSEYTNEAHVTIVVIAPPGNLEFTELSSTSISLCWDDYSNNETNFVIERKEGENGPWTAIRILNTDTAEYVDMDLTPEILYYYRVKAENSTYNVSAYSEELEVMTHALVPPSDLLAEGISPKQISLSWNYDGTDVLDGFIIERKNSDGSFSEIARVGINTKKYLDKDLLPYTQYFYQIKGYNENEYTTYTDEASATTRKIVTFRDLGNYSWAKDAIEDLASRGIIKGKSSGKFAPGDRVTRAEFISLIVRSFNLSRTPYGSFADVNPSDWFYRDVMTAKILGIALGKGNNLFYPNQFITREEMAVIVVRTLKIMDIPLQEHDPSILIEFSDYKKISSNALSGIASLYGEKIMDGKSSSLFAPKQKAIRAEVAVILYNILNR